MIGVVWWVCQNCMVVHCVAVMGVLCGSVPLVWWAMQNLIKDGCKTRSFGVEMLKESPSIEKRGAKCPVAPLKRRGVQNTPEEKMGAKYPVAPWIRPCKPWSAENLSDNECLYIVRIDEQLIDSCLVRCPASVQERLECFEISLPFLTNFDFFKFVIFFLINTLLRWSFPDHACVCLVFFQTDSRQITSEHRRRSHHGRGCVRSWHMALVGNKLSYVFIQIMKSKSKLLYIR